MAKNLYPANCQQVLVQYAPLAHSLAAASGLSLDDLRQEIALAWLSGRDPASAVPAAIGVRRLPGGAWRSQDLAVAATAADDIEPTEMPRPKARRGSVAAGVAADLGLGLRAAQKRLKRQRDAAGAGQGDLFMDGEK